MAWGGVGHHLPDRGQGADDTSAAMVWHTASPRARVATPGRCDFGHHLPDRGQAVLPCAHVATPGRSVAWAASAITCRIAARPSDPYPLLGSTRRSFETIQ
jgi:hypothetical protein